MTTVLLTSSCGATRRTVASVREVRDSIFIVETLRDTLVRVEADSSLIRALLECDSLGRVRIARITGYQAGLRTRPPQVTVADNVLTARSTVDSLSVYIRWKERYERHETSEFGRETVTVEVNRLTRMQRFWIIAGKLWAALMTVVILFRLLLRFR